MVVKSDERDWFFIKRKPVPTTPTIAITPVKTRTMRVFEGEGIDTFF